MACFDIETTAKQYAELYREALRLKLKAESLKVEGERWKEKMNIERPTSNVEWEKMGRR